MELIKKNSIHHKMISLTMDQKVSAKESLDLTRSITRQSIQPTSKVKVITMMSHRAILTTLMRITSS